MTTNTIRMNVEKGKSKMVAGDVLGQKKENVDMGTFGIPLITTTIVELYGGQLIEIYEHDSPQRHFVNISILTAVPSWVGQDDGGEQAALDAMEAGIRRSEQAAVDRAENQYP